MAWTLKILLLSVMTMKTTAQNWCSNSTVLRTRTSCHSCSISLMIPCPSGFQVTPKSTRRDCKYHIQTSSLTLAISGCSFECYKEVQIKTCCPGFWGPDCVGCPGDSRGTCSGRGSCSDGLGGNGSCSCQSGFTGTACEMCESGRYGSTCSEECSCLHGVCTSGLHGDGSCLCFSGYRGQRCDQELPECLALACPASSRCVEDALTGRLDCQCLQGYRRSGSQCVSIDPCLQRVCHSQASCIHTGPDQHLCACNAGFTGDGLVCTQVDPCQTGLGGCRPQTTRCVYDGPGKSHCECLPGFDLLLNGSCSLKDSCGPGSCHKDATCSTVGPGRVECTCLPGFLGNGKVCYGNIIQRLQDLNSEPGGEWTGQLSKAIAMFQSVSWPLQNLGPFTVFVPENKGFRSTSVKSLTSDPSRSRYLCKMHLVAGVMPLDTLKKTDVFYTLTGKTAESETSEGTRIRVHGSRRKGLVLGSDLLASNGMIHIINKLMDSVTPTVTSDPQENLLKIVSDYGKFDQFKSLLERAGLDLVLDRPGPVTVFAPSSSAFDLMTEGHLLYLSSAEGRHKLVELLRNHIVPSASLDVFNVVSSSRLVSMANQVLTINVTENGQVLVNGAAVLESAVEAKNGFLYVVDGVLTPPSIQPVLPHRCDLTHNKVIKGECVSCSKVKVTPCPSGVHTGFHSFGCVYMASILGSPVKIPATGCSAVCNATTTTPACCKGFYGPDCSPCPGGFQTPCSGHGQCSEGLGGNGSCVCDSNFGGSRCQFCSSPSKFGPNCNNTCLCLHGRCENRPDSDGRCVQGSCSSGFSGTFCERRTAVCGSPGRFCHAHADCDFSRNTPRCVCRAGYHGDGITCQEEDPCAPPLRGGCSPNAKCVTTGPASRVCECLIGWRPDGDDCQPINNCQGPDRGGCHDNATCIFVGPGQSDCSCNAGFKGDGRDCDSVNGCGTTGDCHQMASCRLLWSGWRCVCDDGYVGDGQTCYGNVLQVLAVLPDVSDFLSWTGSDSGLSRILTAQNLTVLVPSSAAVERMSPEDRTFWTRKGNLPSLLRNHLIPGSQSVSSISSTSSLTSLLNTSLPVSSANEVVSVGGASITTANIAATNGLIHVIDQVLVPDRKWSEGLLAVLSLRPEFSLFRSALIDHGLMDEIEGRDAFTVFAPTDAAVRDFLKRTGSTKLDVNTTRYHVVTAQRLLRSDIQAGGYKETLLGFSFRLRLLLRDGKLLVNESPVASSFLLTANGAIHGLDSVLEIIRNRCDVSEYTKVMGPCSDCWFPKSPVCPADSVPDPSIKKRKCMFSRMLDGDKMISIGCKTTCLQQRIDRRCCSGFYGEHCESCPGPRVRPCWGNGACSEGTNGTGVCRCYHGYNGTACETCQTGRYGVFCDQECVCVHGRCSEGFDGDGSCECDVGWRGVSCDQKIESRSDELCGGVTCHTSANCVSRSSGPQCLCAAGFEGNGTFCQAVDPCVWANGGCSSIAFCKRTRPGRRECVCSDGYHGDGLVCVEINPCLEGNGSCHANADCIHTGPNKTSCVCSEGYTGDGRRCEMIDLCQTNNGGCHFYSATCNMTAPGVRTCRCKTNFIGDGVTCRDNVEKTMLLSRSVREFYYGLMITGISVKGRGPFTVFAPSSEAFKAEKISLDKMTTNKEEFSHILRSHIVMCHTLLPSDLQRPRNLTSLSGLVLTTGSDQGRIFVNEANVTYSDDVSSNGVYHRINKLLVPLRTAKPTGASSQVNLSDVAEAGGYTTFYKLLEDSGVMRLVDDPIHQPVTVFLPTDAAMAALPQDQKDFLFHPDHRDHLEEYLKYHVLQDHKVYAEGLIHLDSVRTLQGSPLSFSCGGPDAIGEVYVSDRKCRIVRRHLVFSGGVAYGIDCLLTPPSLGGRCDTKTTFDLTMSCGMCSPSGPRCLRGSKLKEVQKCDLPLVFVTRNSGCRSVCTVNFWQPKCCHGYHGRDCLACPGGAASPCSNRGRCDDGHLGNGTCTCDPGFGGVACELCSPGYYGDGCTACRCSDHGSCDDGRRGTGSCFCETGWTGDRCETPQAAVPQCTPSCSEFAVCQQNNSCVCRPSYQGDGLTCTVMDLCGTWNGGCSPGAKCSQKGDQVTCTCPKGHSGDGYVCLPVDPCVSGDNGGCHQHATCTMTAPGKRKCVCRDSFIGDGLTCELRESPVSRCLQDNGRCHRDAACTDLHYEDATLGVFHVRSPAGQYKLNFSDAQQLCSKEGGVLASYTQLSYAQQGGLNMCAAGWLDQARVAYPTTYSNPNCGFGHVGIVDYGTRDQSQTWDAFCYRMKEVKCECRSGFIGDGLSCTGTLLQVLQTTSRFSNFLTQVLNVSQSESGRNFLKRLRNTTMISTLFVPHNDGLHDNQTLSLRDIEYHLSEGRVLRSVELRNGTLIRTRVGTLRVLGVVDLLRPSQLASRFINDVFVLESDILASNGVIHVLQGPLQAPPPKTQMKVSHQAGLGLGLVLVLVLVSAGLYVGVQFYSKTRKPFNFHYFKEEDAEDEAPPPSGGGQSICNPVYEAEPGPAESSPDQDQDQDQETSRGHVDLLQDS